MRPSSAAPYYDGRLCTDLAACQKRIAWCDANRITLPADHLIRSIDAQLGIQQYWLPEAVVEQGSVTGMFNSVLDAHRLKHGRLFNIARIAGTSSAAGPSEGSGFAKNMPFFQRRFISLQRIELTPEQDVVIARYLLIATLAAMLFSSSLTVGLEFVVYATFLLRPSLRVRFLAILREPTGIALVFFVAALLIGVLHGLASWPERMAAFAGWRRVLLFFFETAVFNEERAKRDVLSAFLIVCALAVIASYLTFLTPASFFRKFRNGIIIHNHATQGVVFALAAVIAALAVIWPTSVINNRF